MNAILHSSESLSHDHAAHAHGGDHAHHDIGFLRKYIFSTDHKIIGIQFLFLGLIFFVIGGLLAMLVRWQLGWPDATHIPWIIRIIGKLVGWNGGQMPPDLYTE